MERIQSFKSFSDVKKQLKEKATLEETNVKRATSATAFAELLKKYEAATIADVTEDKLQDFMSELVGNFKFEKTNESVETIKEAMGIDLSPEVAASIVKKYGNEKWGERAGYGDQEGYYILRSLGIQMAKAAGIDKAPGDFDYPYSIYFDGGSLVLGDKTVGQTRGKSLAQVAQMYTALVGKALAALAKKNKSNESVEAEVIEEGNKNREMVASAWMKTGVKDLNGIAKLYADAMEDANFHQEMGTSKAIGSASRGKVSGLKGSDIASAAGWDGYAIANGTVDFLREIGEEAAANKLYKAISKYDLNESIAFATTDLVTAIMEGTRGQFGKIYKSGEIASVYTHYDSYPEHMLPTIKKGYKKGTDVDAVLGKGDNSGLEVSPDKMKFYGDQNSLKPMMGTVKNLKKYVNDADAQGAEYIYLFDERDQKWYMVDVYGDRDLVPAFEAVEVNEGISPEVIVMISTVLGIPAMALAGAKLDSALEKAAKNGNEFAAAVLSKLRSAGKAASSSMRSESVVNEAEVDIMDEVGGDIHNIYGKLNDLAEETTDTKWRKAIESIIKGLEGVENKIGQTANKLGVVPTHESEEVEEDVIPGGLSGDITPQQIADKHGIDISEIEAALVKGVKVEMEHTDDEKIAHEVAMDHLFEDPKYYDKLADMEKESIEVEEGNAFGAARAEAIAKGEKTFKVGDEEYDVESVDKEDKENAEEFANEAEGAAIPAETMTADTTKGEEKKVINGEEVDEEPKEVTLEPLVEGAKEEQEAMELYVKLVDPKTGKYTEKEMQAMSEKDIVEVVDAEGYKGSEAKKLASELVKIAKG